LGPKEGKGKKANEIRGIPDHIAQNREWTPKVP